MSQCSCIRMDIVWNMAEVLARTTKMPLVTTSCRPIKVMWKLSVNMELVWSLGMVFRLTKLRQYAGTRRRRIRDSWKEYGEWQCVVYMVEVVQSIWHKQYATLS